MSSENVQVGKYIKYKKVNVLYYGDEFAIIKSGESLKIKDEVVNYLTPYINQCESCDEAYNIVNEKISQVDSAVNSKVTELTNKVNNKVTEVNNKVSELTTSVNSNISTINSTMTNIKNQFNALSPEQSTNAEVQLSRTDIEGTTHNSLNERLRKIEIMPSLLWEVVEG